MNPAQEMYELVDNLRANVEEAYGRRGWANDSQFAQSYEQLARQAAAMFSDDPIIGQLQVSIPPELEALLDRDPSCLTTWVRMQLGRLSTRLSQLSRRHSGRAATIADLALEFMRDDGLRNIVANDFTEAQRAYYANAPKAAAILCGGVLEGMLLDVLRRPEIQDDERFSNFVQQIGGRRFGWDRATLGNLLQLTDLFALIRPSTFRLATSVTDFRNTVHPAKELRSRIRAGEREANILISVVQLVAADLNGTYLEGSIDNGV